MKTNTLLLLVFSSILFAQPRGPMGGGVQGEGRVMAPPPGGDMHMQDHGRSMPSGLERPDQEKMNMMMMWRLTEELSLSEDQAAVLFPKLNKHREELDQIDEELMKLGDEIREKIDSGEEITDKYFKKSLQTLTDLKHTRVDAETNFLISVKGTLSNEQLMKLSTFERRFKRELREKMRNRGPHGVSKNGRNK